MCVSLCTYTYMRVLEARRCWISPELESQVVVSHQE